MSGVSAGGLRTSGTLAAGSDNPATTTPHVDLDLDLDFDFDLDVNVNLNATIDFVLVESPTVNVDVKGGV
jgi:hypothetical protein